eukprot:jgi/Chlat1/9268/Chrsp99S08491
MAGLLNIGQSNSDDAFYRYKMPRLIAKIEGRGNGIKTNIVNMVDIAKALSRPPSYTTKFFGCELGAQSKYDDKTAVSIVNGAHDGSKLSQLLEGFIKRFVQCYACGNPETEINIGKGEIITLQCKACGNVSNVDMRHKLTTFILKNPPEKKSSKKEKQLRRAEQERLKTGEAIDAEQKKSSKKDKDKDKKKKDKDEKKKKGEEQQDEPAQEEVQDQGSNEDEEEEEEDVEWMTDTSAAAVKARMQEQLTTATSEMVNVGNGDIVEGESPKDKKEKKDKSKKKDKKDKDSGKEEEPSENGSGNGDVDHEEESPRDVKDKKDKSKKKEKKDKDDGKQEVETPDKELAELSMHDKLIEEMQEYLSGPGKDPANAVAFLDAMLLDSEQAKMDLLCEALFGSEPSVAKAVFKKKGYLAAAATDTEAQARILLAMEAVCSQSPARAKEIAVALKVLYDEDIVDEEVIFAWYDGKASAGRQENGHANGSANGAVDAPAMRKCAFPFINWLRTADEEESEEED